MTIGDKIKFFRKKQNITQGTLAELSGIHPVSIRKYETNKMIPQAPQIQRIAKGLQVNAIALTGVDIPRMRFHTVGDVMGVLMLLLNTGILEMTWGNLDNGEIDFKMIEIKPHPAILFFIENDFITQETHQPVISDLVFWYVYRNEYDKLLTCATAEERKDPNSKLNQSKALKESQENRIQSNKNPFLIPE